MASASGAVATLTITGSSLAVGIDTITANYTATGNFSSSNGSVVVTVVSPAAGTATTATVSPANIAASGAAQITAFVKPLTGGSGAPTGNVTFTTGNKILGTGVLSNGIAALSVQGANLATGSNSIAATYGGSSSFSGSASTPVIVLVASPAIATSTVVTAGPAAIAKGSATILTAIVKAGPGGGVPTGNILFAIGNTLLGSVEVTGTGNTGTAALQINGSSLALGQNSITASYVPTENFASSSSSLVVNVTSSPAATTLALSANPGSKPSTIVLTGTVQAASGSMTPTGSITFALGSTLLGSAVLTESGAGATGTLTINNSNLAPGNNTIVATYAGNTTFSRSTSSVIVNVAKP